jgi:excisionase family DNA binding protein
VEDPAEQFDVSDEERAVLARLLPESGKGPIVLRAGKKDVRLPPGVSLVVRRLLDRLAAGESVQLVSADAELTTREAAELLGISRTYLVRLVDEGRVPAHMVGSHRRLKASDVLAFRREREERLAKVAAIAEADAELGIPY